MYNDGIHHMPARTANQFFEFNVEGTNKKLKQFNIKVPFPIKINFRPEYTEEAKACYLNHTMPQIINGLWEDREIIVNEFKKLGYYIHSVDQMTFQISEFCPLCEKRGIPSIVRKNTDHPYTIKSNSFDRLMDTKTYKNKNKPFWLKFYHGKGDNCWVQQWQGTNEGTFKPKLHANKQIDPRKYFISYAIKKAIRN